jgi:hypothetical protein
MTDRAAHAEYVTVQQEREWQDNKAERDATKHLFGNFWRCEGRSVMFTAEEVEIATRALFYYILGTKNEWTTMPEQMQEFVRAQVRVVLKAIEEERALIDRRRVQC